MTDTSPARRRSEQASSGGGGAVSFLGLVGALVFFWQQADGGVDYLWAILKSMVWPAFLVYEAFGALAG